MKQVQDKKTKDLLEPEAPRRGRPPKADALTGAERAKRFRDAHRGEAPKAVTITVTEKAFRAVQSAEQSRTLALASAHAEIRILTAKLAEKEAEIAALKSRRKAVK